MTATTVTAGDIERAALARLKVPAAGVARHLERDPDVSYDQRTTWYGLSIRRAAGDAWELVDGVRLPIC